MKRTRRHTLVFGLLALIAAAYAGFGSAAVRHAAVGAGSPAAWHQEDDCQACQSAGHAAALAPAPAVSWLERAEDTEPAPYRGVAQPRRGRNAEAARAPPARLVT